LERVAGLVKGQQEGLKGRLPEKVFWDDAEPSQSFWLSNTEARRKDVAASYIVLILSII
jgi:hypothetical protein